MRTIATLLALTMAVNLLSVTAFSQQDDERTDGIHKVVFRNAAGELTSDSVYFSNQIAQKANDQGRVLIWVTIDVPHKLHTAGMTDKQLSDQETRVAVAYAQLLKPLIRRGEVLYPNGQPKIVGQSSQVWASAAGLERLIDDDRVVHIVQSADMAGKRPVN